MVKKFFCKLKLTFLPCQKNKYKPKFLASKILFYYALFLLLLKLAIIPIFFYFPKTVFFADITKTNLIEFANTTREHFGLQPLKENPALSQAAYLKAKDMVEKDYFAHYSPEGISPWYWLKTSGYNYRLAGENLAIGFLESEQVHQAWMDSFSHQKNILNPAYQEIGIAVLSGNFQGNETTLVVQYFGTPRTILLEQETLPSPVLMREERLEIPIVIEEEIEQITEEKEEEKEPISEKATVFEPKEMITLAVGEEFEKNSAFLLFQFMTSRYYDLVQKIIYGSLILIIISLLVTVYCDIFIYRKFKIDHKDIAFKTIGFSVLSFVLVFLDKLIIIQIISQNFRIN